MDNDIANGIDINNRNNTYNKYMKNNTLKNINNKVNKYNNNKVNKYNNNNKDN